MERSACVHLKHIKKVAGAATEGECFLTVTPQRETMTVLCHLIPEKVQNQPPARLSFGHAPWKSLLKTDHEPEALRSI